MLVQWPETDSPLGLSRHQTSVSDQMCRPSALRLTLRLIPGPMDGMDGEPESVCLTIVLSSCGPREGFLGGTFGLCRHAMPAKASRAVTLSDWLIASLADSDDDSMSLEPSRLPDKYLCACLRKRASQQMTEGGGFVGNIVIRSWPENLCGHESDGPGTRRSGLTTQWGG